MESLPGGCNPADVLFKLAHGRGIKPPVFDQVAEQGPPHAKTFSWSCSFFEGNYKSVGHGRSKKEAKNAAAKNLITQLDLSKLPQKPQKHHHHDNKRKMSNLGDSESTPPRFGKKRRGGGMRGGLGWMGGPPNPMFGGFLSQEMMNSPGFGGMGFPGMYGGGYGGGYGGRIIPPRRTLEDNLVLEKHQSIYPAEDDLEKILAIVDKVEQSLKNISDKFLEEADSASTDREVTGVARVGDLAKTLCLRGDNKVELVVLCSHRPTTSLLQTITAALTTDLATPDSNEAVAEEEKKENEEVDAGCEYSVTECEEASGLRVRAPACTVSVSLTSPVLRSGQDPALSDPAAWLPSEPGLAGLAELRRAKWFSAMAASLPGCVETIRLLRDLARRDVVWAGLGDWPMELLVERSLFSAGHALPPSKSLLRVMEVLAAGLILPDGPGIKDPCEREEVDVFSHLSSQTREDITRAAQEQVRNIHYRKIRLTLGMEDRLEVKVEDKLEDRVEDMVKDMVKDRVEVKVEEALQGRIESDNLE